MLVGWCCVIVATPCVRAWNPSWHTVRTRSGRAPSSGRAGAPRPAARTHHAASACVFVFDVVPRAGPRSNTSIHGSVGIGPVARDEEGYYANASLADIVH